MSYENIRLRKQNFVVVEGYFYSFDKDTDTLIVKTDDGTQAFSYPLDTVLTNEVICCEHDGYNFWTLENPGSNTIIIRRWYINNYVCTLRTTKTLVPTASDYYNSNAITVEHYDINFSANESSGQSILSVTTGGKPWSLPSKLGSNQYVVLGPSTDPVDKGAVEEIKVSSAGASTISLNTPTNYAYKTGDPITFYKNIWVFNNYYGTSATGGLYKLDGLTLSPIAKYESGAYSGITACTFYDMTDYLTGGSDSIVYIKATNMIFLDPDDLTDSFGSMSMDNLEDNLSDTISIYDVTMYGNNVYRLQRKATYYGSTVTFADGTYNYQLSTLEPFITSISLRAEPAILPADTVSDSTITAIVKDQFNQPISGKTVEFTDDDSYGSVSPTSDSTDTNGVATTVYNAGNTAREVTITATAQQT